MSSVLKEFPEAFATRINKILEHLIRFLEIARMAGSLDTGADGASFRKLGSPSCPLTCSR